MSALTLKIKNKRMAGYMLYAFFVAGAGVISFFLFLLMQALIVSDDDSLIKTSQNIKIDFIRIKQNEDEDLKTPKRPQQRAKEPPLSPKRERSRVAQPLAPTSINPLLKAIPQTQKLSLQNNLALNTSGEVLPLVRLAPQYPMEALNRRVEGWVLLEFSVSKTGGVLEPKVIKADPPFIFNKAALRAVRRWKYKPQVIDGAAQRQKGVQTLITFKLEK